MLRTQLIRLGRVLDTIPFRIKIVGLVLGITFVLGATAGLELRRDTYDVLSHELDHRGRSIALELSERAGDHLATRDVIELDELLRVSKRHNGDLSYALVVDEKGRVAASTYLGVVPQALVGFEADPERAGAEGVTVLELDGERVREIRAPLYGQRSNAEVRVGMSEQRIDAALDRATSQLLVLTVAAGATAALFGLLLTRLLLSPLEDLISSMKRLSRGDLAHRARPSIDRDMAFMATSFNDMAEEVEGQTIALLEQQGRLAATNRELALLQRLSVGCDTSIEPNRYLEDSVRLSVDELDAEGGWACARASDGKIFSAAVGVASGHPLESCVDTCLLTCRLFAGSEGEVPPDCPAYGFGEQRAGREPTLRGLRVSISPLPVRGGVEGMVAGVYRSEDFDPDMHGVLRAVASQIGVVMENLILRKDREERERRLSMLLARALETQEAERSRVARELHDDIGQKMTFLKLGLKVLDPESLSHEQSRDLVAGLRETVSEGIDGIRRAIANLGPAPVEDLGLSPALERLLREASARFGFSSDFQAVGEDAASVGPAASLAAYRIVQEALSNAGRHGQCSRVSIVLRQAPGTVDIVIEDDGCGFDVSAVSADRSTGSQVGMDGMRERAELAGGILLIESTPECGTTVHLRLPLDDMVAAGEGQGIRV